MLLIGSVSCTVLSKDEYAVSRIGGQTVICADLSLTPCGASLDNCTTGSRYSCVFDIEILNLRQVRQRADRYTRENAQ